MKVPYLSARDVIRTAWAATAVAVIVGSLLPRTSDAFQALSRLPLGDKFEHTAMYALLVLLPAIHERKSIVIRAAVGAVSLGVALEFAQRWTGLRNFEIADMAADTIGVALGLLTGSALRTFAAARIYCE
jgi:VanZ family protein